MEKGEIKIGVIGIVIILLIGGVLIWQYQKEKSKTAVTLITPTPEATSSLVLTEKETKLNYQNIINQMFPEKKFTETKEKYFKDKDNQTYYIENIFEGYFINPEEKNLLVIVRRPSEELTHSEGFYNAFLAVFDLKGENILTENFLIKADEGKITLYNCKAGTFILFTGSTISQGWVDGAISLYKAKDKKFERVWPSQKDLSDTWTDRIAESKEDKIEIYVRKTGIESNFVCPTKCLNSSPDNVTPNFVFIYSFDMFWDKNTCFFQ